MTDYGRDVEFGWFLSPTRRGPKSSWTRPAPRTGRVST